MIVIYLNKSVYHRHFAIHRFHNWAYHTKDWSGKKYMVGRFYCCLPLRAIRFLLRLRGWNSESIERLISAARNNPVDVADVA